MRKFIWIFRVEGVQIVDEYLILDISEDELVFKAEEGRNRMLVEFDTFDDLVGLSIDMVEDVPADDCVDSLVLSSSNAVDRPTCFVHCFGFAIADVPCTDGSVIRSAN